MRGERTPPYPADADNLAELISFVQNADACAKWMAQSLEVIERNQALLGTIGKADEIDDLHAEAQELKNTVLSAISQKEDALKAERELFAEEMAAGRANLVEEQRISGEKVQRLEQEATEARNAAATARKAAEDANAEAQSALKKADADKKAAAEMRTTLADKLKSAKALAESLNV